MKRNIPEITAVELAETVAEMAAKLEQIRTWIYGTDLGYTVVAYSESNPVTVYKCVLRSLRNLRTIADSLPRRQSVTEP